MLYRTFELKYYRFDPANIPLKSPVVIVDFSFSCAYICSWVHTVCISCPSGAQKSNSMSRICLLYFWRCNDKMFLPPPCQAWPKSYRRTFTCGPRVVFTSPSLASPTGKISSSASSSLANIWSTRCSPPGMEVTKIIFAKTYRFCQLSSHSRHSL